MDSEGHYVPNFTTPKPIFAIFEVECNFSCYPKMSEIFVAVITVGRTLGALADFIFSGYEIWFSELLFYLSR